LSVTGVAQMLVAEPGLGSASHKLAQIFVDCQQQASLRMRLWMPPSTHLSPESPWLSLADSGQLLARPHPAPALLILSDAADWLAANQIYGERPDLPRLHLLHGADLRHWGHGALAQPAIRLAFGEGVAAALRRTVAFKEPLHVLPMALEPHDLPRPALVRQGVLVLAGDHPALGLAVQQTLLERGLPCRCEVSTWSRQRWQQALAEAVVVVVLASPYGLPGLGLRRLAAMALGTALVMEERRDDDGLVRNGQNGVVRLGDARELAQAAAEVYKDDQFRQRLVQGGHSTVLRYRTALERLRLQAVLNDLPAHWSQARAAHLNPVSLP